MGIHGHASMQILYHCADDCIVPMYPPCMHDNNLCADHTHRAPCPWLMDLHSHTPSCLCCTHADNQHPGRSQPHNSLPMLHACMQDVQERMVPLFPDPATGQMQILAGARNWCEVRHMHVPACACMSACSCCSAFTPFAGGLANLLPFERAPRLFPGPRVLHLTLFTLQTVQRRAKRAFLHQLT